MPRKRDNVDDPELLRRVRHRLRLLVPREQRDWDKPTINAAILNLDLRYEQNRLPLLQAIGQQNSLSEGAKEAVLTAYLIVKHESEVE